MRYAATLAALLIGCATHSMQDFDAAVNPLAERYVRLVLAVGEHDADYVDAYYGPPRWREEAKASKRTLAGLESEARQLRDQLSRLHSPEDRLRAQRLRYLRRQTEAVIARLEMLQGKKYSFDEEARLLYDAGPPRLSEDYFRTLNAQLDQALPGSGPLIEQLEAFRKQFVIPPDKLDAVFKAAIAECRARTLPHIDLPPGESFTVEYVKNKSWSGYNWYQGNYRSLIQVNTDLPIYIDRAIDLACHEGYPGHHAYNVLLEKNLVRDRGWVEYSVYPLFSPQSLIAEGSANYGIETAFTREARMRFERETLFPLAGLDPSRVEEYYRVYELADRSSYAGNEAARRYLNGEFTAAQAADWLTRYALMSPERAKQRVRFIDQYRSYVINYNLGKDLVREHVQKVAGEQSGKRWETFEELLSTPQLPSDLK